jgi:hypothetical protein
LLEGRRRVEDGWGESPRLKPRPKEVIAMSNRYLHVLLAFGIGVLTTLALIALAGFAGGRLIAAQGAAAPVVPPTLVVQSAILSGLAPGAVFPFIDSTPHQIASAHIAVTDATTTCTAGATAPTNVQVLVGQAGGTLAPVMTAATNTGITTTAGQCVFHVTVTPGSSGVPATVTDIVVRNQSGSVALTGVNTVTVSAVVRQ